MKYLIMFNPLSNNKCGEADSKKFEACVENGEFTYKSVLEISSMPEFFASIPDDVTPVLAGGDGTINRFVNLMEGVDINRELIYFPAGSGNDFMKDVAKEGESYVILNPYIKDLPFVEVNGMKQRFINGIGYGIDGYCCEVGDKLRETSDKPINYAGIAIKGLLFYFKPLNATVVTDGIVKEFKKAWLAPTMNGRYYGGGMNATPIQDRLDPDRKLTTLVMYGKGKLKTLMVFPSIFKGEHIKHTEMVSMISGHDVTVSFDKPCALQIDGETVLNVNSYHVYKA